jgi:hypothetical protein
MRYIGWLVFGILSLGLAGTAKAQNDNPPLGARAVGMGNAAVTVADVWSLSNNVAGIAELKSPEIAAYAENRFLMRALSTVAVQGVYSFGKFGTAGAELYRFGDDLYSEQRIGLGFGHKLGMVSLGLKADVIQVSFHDDGTGESGSKKTVALSFGGQATLIPELVFGAHVYNFNQAKMAAYQDERIPTVMKAGVSYRPTPKLMVNAETEKNIDLKADFKAGAEYQLLDKFAVRSGFSTLSESFSYGASFTARQFRVDYAMGGLVSDLGISNHLSVSYKWE